MPSAGATFRRVPPEEVARDLWRLLVAADREFVPPLSSRNDTTQADLDGAPAADAPAPGPTAYLASLLEQDLLVAEAGGRVVGLASFRPHHRVTLPDGAVLEPVTYLSTLIVDAEARGLGVARGLYALLDEVAAAVGAPIVTRTWSTNHAHGRVLAAVGLRELARIVDDRGPGVDTVYYVKETGAP